MTIQAIPDSDITLLPDLPSEAPEQPADVPKWEYQSRREPKWGQVTRQGLILGRAPNQRIVDPTEVYKLALIGMNWDEMADFFQVTHSTLKYNFSSYVQKARSEMRSRLRRAMWQNAIDGKNVVMQIFMAKNYLGMSDSPVNTDGKQPLPWTAAEADQAA